MSVDVVVPFLSDCPHREQAWAWVRARYEATSWGVVVAEHAPGPWCKAAAVMPAIASSSADVVVVSDADCWTDGVQSAVRAVTCGVAEWAVPHAPDIRRLTREGTAAALAGEPWEAQTLDEPPYPGVIGGGIVVGARETLLSVPMDPRFTGFSREDYCWGMALRVLIGEPWRGEAPLVHLWHPPQEGVAFDRKYGSMESYRLAKRYQHSRDPEAMRALLDEIGDPCAFTARPTPTSASRLLPTA